ncbi:hypothetical protein P875_00138552 [Aspergillus parasiticus SU-1]|uniref:Uncharacterized protein n=1 Tax=Aspergillus parasiticus (strain ATCC 56775 / NRRL 5862 / SRRC 143 / SU-1) TaxID=1403190 RepID=A0A0F0IDU9_ASPPU|nr:hypothetical protein P875_00138552 [Aspergillus parasiticus SU-1]
MRTFLGQNGNEINSTVSSQAIPNSALSYSQQGNPHLGTRGLRNQVYHYMDCGYNLKLLVVLERSSICSKSRIRGSDVSSKSWRKFRGRKIESTLYLDAAQKTL